MNRKFLNIIVIFNQRGVLNSEVTADEMWQVMEDYGIDRQLLESTNPSQELIFRLYCAIKQVKENSEIFEKENMEFLNPETVK